MGGSTSQQSFASSSGSTVSGPNPQVAGFLGSNLGSMWGYYEDNPTAPAYYPDGTVAPRSAQTLAANTALYNRGLAGLGSLDAAGRQQIGDTVQGRYLDIASNPYFGRSLAASFQPQVERLTADILPAIDAKFAGAGRTASGAHLDTTMRAVKDLEQTQSNAAAAAAQSQYEAERNRQYAALGMLPMLQNMDYQNLGAMAQAGAASDAYAQRLLDDSNARYRYDQTAQPDWMSQIAQRLIAAYPGGQTTGSSTTSGWSTPSTDGGMGLLAGFLPAAGGGAARLAAMAAPAAVAL